MLLFFNLSGILSECQTVCIQIKPSILLGLIWGQTGCKDYQQMTPVGKDLSAEFLRQNLPVAGPTNISQFNTSKSFFSKKQTNSP